MANSTVKFKVLTPKEFNKRYPEALACTDGNIVGEVLIPGHGWHACLVGGHGKPTRFYSDDDGWEPAPVGVKFEQV